MRTDILYADAIGETYRPRRIIEQCLNEGVTNSVTRRYGDWFNRVRTRAIERNISYRFAQWEFYQFCFEREFKEAASESDSKSNETSETNECAICELTDNGGNEVVANHICELRKQRKELTKCTGRVVQPPREKPYYSSGEDHTGAEPKLTAALKKKRKDTKRKLGLIDYIGPVDYDADNEDECPTSPKRKGNICNEYLPNEEKLQKHIIGAHVIPMGREERSEHDQPMLPLELAPSMHPRECTNVQELTLKWKDRREEARNMPDERAISWNGNSLIWNHRNNNEANFLVVKPSENEVKHEDIEHITKQEGHEHAANQGQGNPELEKTIRDYFDEVQLRLSRFINKLRVDLQAQMDTRRQMRSFEGKNSDEEMNEVIGLRRNSNAPDERGGQKG